MIHYRIIGSILLLFGGIGLGFSGIECVRLLRLSDVPLKDGAFVSTLMAVVFCASSAATSIGLFRAKRWARIVGGIVAFLLGLYCLSFILMVGSEFGAFWLAFAFLGVLFVGYTLFVIWVFAPHDEA